MGLKIAEFVKPVSKEHSNLSFCKDSKVVIDTSIFLYKFVYSYGDNWLTGFSSQLALFSKYNITPVYVFDSKPPLEKQKLLEKRKEVKTINITPEMKQELREFFESDNISIEDSPDYVDGEKHCCDLAGEDDYVLSSDYDVFLYGAKNVIRPVKGTWCLVNTKELLDHLELTSEQFRDLCICIGTDFNPGGLKNIGPKKGLKMIKEGKELPIDSEELTRLRNLFEIK